MGNDVAPAQCREVLILNLNTFAAKNVSQIRLMQEEGYDFTIVTHDSQSRSRQIFEDSGFRRSKLVILGGGIAKVSRSIAFLLRRWHHVELYPAGRMAILYLLAIKLLRHRLLVIERGDIDSLEYYDRLTRLSLKLAYRLADCVVYKETYMEARLKAFTNAPLAFIPNCIESRAPSPKDNRPIDFLWVNRVIPQRRPEWVAEALGDPRLAGRELLMLGVEPEAELESHLSDRQRLIGSTVATGVSIRGFVDPTPYYGKSRFFCLPATVVFGNNALLEAMASGVVPIVTEAPGVDLIIENGVNGFVTAFDESEYRDVMVRAAGLTAEEWQTMSGKAVETVRENYSPQTWTRRMAAVYDRLNAA